MSHPLSETGEQMTLDEAKLIANIIGTADHGCSVCVGNLVERMNRDFPQFKWERGDSEMPLYDRDEDDTWSKQMEVLVSLAAPAG